MYDVHFGLIGKRVVDLLLVIIELFSLGVMAEALRRIYTVSTKNAPPFIFPMTLSEINQF